MGRKKLARAPIEMHRASGLPAGGAEGIIAVRPPPRLRSPALDRWDVGSNRQSIAYAPGSKSRLILDE